MSELESSGLLTRDAPEPESASRDESQPSDAAAKPEDGTLTPVANSQQAGGQDAAEPNLAAAIVDAVTNDTVEVLMEQQDNAEVQEEQQGMTDASEAEAADGAGEEGGEAAEQRVLGDLEGAPSWKEVRPTAAHHDCKSFWVPCTILCLFKNHVADKRQTSMQNWSFALDIVRYSSLLVLCL